MPALESGKYVICDRYKDSTRAYQRDSIAPYVTGSVDEYIQRNMEWAPEADYTLLLDVDAETSVSRTGERDKYEKKEFLQSVRKNYIDVYSESPEMEMIDATKKKEDVVEEAVSKIMKFIYSNETT
jgi:dTMP kinase